VKAEYGRTEVVKYLIEMGAKIEVPMKSGATPLVIAVQNNRR
jgi:ankyrin repeat protein